MENPVVLGVFLPVKGIKVWVNHGFENAGVWHCATVAGNSVGAVLLAVEKALDRHLVGAERDGGRSCFLEDLLLVEQNDFTREVGIGPTDLVVRLGS